MSRARGLLSPRPGRVVSQTAGDASFAIPGARLRRQRRSLTSVSDWSPRNVRPELVALLAVAGFLNLWDLSRNAWANGYYAAAVRSMISSWHNFLYGSFDPSGVMTVDKPPLAFWVQALSAKVFGFSSWSILVPQALMGMATVALIYDIVRRRFGRLGGFVAGLTLAITPITVAMSRHNNPDAAVVLCCVAALWFAVRAFEDGRTRWIVWAGVMVGLGFEAKMSTALLVVPGIAVAWLWASPNRPLQTIRQLLAAGAAMVAVGGAWPLLVALTPASDRPWISGTADNSIWSLITNYNGVGRIAGQSGGPAAAGGFGGGGGGGGSTFGGSSGAWRLLNTALGGQAGWLLGFAAVSGIGLLVLTRLRRRDPETGWLLAVGGAALTSAVVFSVAQGIFHPYYVSFLAPFSAALVGAGAAVIVRRGRPARIIAPLALAAGVATELAVMHSEDSYKWLEPIVIGVAAAAAIALILLTRPRFRLTATGVALAALSVAPGAWAVDTLGHATSSTFPAGGPANAGGGFGRLGGFGGPGGFGRAGGFSGRGGPPVGTIGRGPASGQGFSGRGGAAPRGVPGGTTASTNGIASVFGAASSARRRRAIRQLFAGGFSGGGFGPRGSGFGAAGFGAFGAGQSLTATLRYIRAHGGGTLAVSSQTSAETAVIDSGAHVAGIGGFSGNESEVSAAWLAQEVRSARIRWALDDESGGGLAGFGGGISAGRVGSRDAMQWVSQACRRATTSNGAVLYDCSGDAAKILAVAAQRAS